MATYYVWSGATGTASGADWTNAFTSFASAVSAATTNGDVIKVHKAHAGVITATTTYTFAADVIVICVDKDNSDALAEMDGSTGYIGNTSATYYLTITGAFKVFFYGVCFRTAGSSNVTQSYATSDGSHFEFEKSQFWLGTTGSTSGIVFGLESANYNSYVKLSYCTIRFGNTGHRLDVRAKLDWYGGGVSSSGSAPSTLFQQTTSQSDVVRCSGVDLSHITGTLIGSHTYKSREYQLINCKLGSGVTVLGTQTPANGGSASAVLFNCSSADENYRIAHYDAFGQTTVTASIYVSDGAEYDTSANKYSWAITTSANCSYYTPYVTPWIHSYNETLSAITPWLECLRDNSSGAVFQNDEVWAEFSYQGTTGYPLGVFVTDRMALLGTPADQTASSKTATDWTGETGTPGFFKIGPASSITPAEIGPLSARVVVGEPSITVYVDPQIRT